MQKNSPFVAIAIMSEIGMEIAVPVVLFSRGGKWLDARFNTAPYLLIAGFVLAFVLSAVIVWKRSRAFEAMYRDL